MTVAKQNKPIVPGSARLISDVVQDHYLHFLRKPKVWTKVEALKGAELWSHRYNTVWHAHIQHLS